MWRTGTMWTHCSECAVTATRGSPLWPFHRLSTIRSADKIVAIKDGRVEEVGTHNSLMKKRGLYYTLVTTQVTEEERSDTDDDEDEDLVQDLEVGKVSP